MIPLWWLQFVIGVWCVTVVGAFTLIALIAPFAIVFGLVALVRHGVRRARDNRYMRSIGAGK